jgi:hypothetical protein
MSKKKLYLKKMIIRKSKRPPVLITLDPDGWEKEAIEFRKIKGKKYTLTTIAIHDPIAHLLSKPCVRILNKPSFYRIRISTIIKIIVHESIHHVLIDLSKRESINAKFDKLLISLPKNHWFYRLFGC